MCAGGAAAARRRWRKLRLRAAATLFPPPPPSLPPSLPQGGDRIKEAATCFRELNDRFGASVAGVNGQAAVSIAQGKYADAERVLEELLESHPAQPDALINLVAIAEHTGRADDAAKWLAALREAAPDHPYLQQLDIVEGTFDRLAAVYTAS